MQMKTLNIKNPEAYRIAETISTATGESMTRVVIEALRQRLAALQVRQEKASVEELLSIARQISSQVQRPYLDHADLLYDENGLPK